MIVQKLSNITICVVGPNKHQNKIMAAFLRRSTEATCLVGGDDCKLPGKAGGKPRIILWDCQDRGSECFSEFETRCDSIPNQDIVVFMDVKPGLGIEADAIHKGVRGFFYESDPLETLATCLQAVFVGQLWFPRKILTRVIHQYSSRFSKKVGDLLSPRESEVLNYVLVGASNREIAEKLFISPGTIKSHTSHINNKIGAPNRFQAILWAAQNL